MWDSLYLHILAAGNMVFTTDAIDGALVIYLYTKLLGTYDAADTDTELVVVRHVVHVLSLLISTPFRG